MAYIAALLQVPVSILASCMINKLQTLVVNRGEQKSEIIAVKGTIMHLTST